MTKPAGQLVIISGPSGVGKSTVVAWVLKQLAGKVRLSVSATTRPPREGEVDGVHYHFLTPEQFEQRRQQGEFLECAEVYGRGYWYGTLLSEVRPSLAEGLWVILEVDVHGAKAALERYPNAVSIFMNVDSLEELERRLRARKTESDEAIRRRLEVARDEMAQAEDYRYQVANQHLERAVEGVVGILKQEGLET